MKKIITITLVLAICLFSQQQVAAQVKTKIYPNGIPKTENTKSHQTSEIVVPTPANLEVLKQSHVAFCGG